MDGQSRIEALRRRVQQDPASIAFAQLAEEHRRAGDFEDAVQVARAGLERHPGYLSARVTLGRSLVELGQLDEAQAELELVLQSAPENLAAIRSLADIYQRHGESRDTSPSPFSDPDDFGLRPLPPSAPPLSAGLDFQSLPPSPPLPSAEMDFRPQSSSSSPLLPESDFEHLPPSAPPLPAGMDFQSLPPSAPPLPAEMDFQSLSPSEPPLPAEMDFQALSPSEPPLSAALDFQPLSPSARPLHTELDFQSLSLGEPPPRATMDLPSFTDEPDPPRADLSLDFALAEFSRAMAALDAISLDLPDFPLAAEHPASGDEWSLHEVSVQLDPVSDRDALAVEELERWLTAVVDEREKVSGSRR